MSAERSKPIDGGRQRCGACGHPRVEHRYGQGCTVPNCPCDDYQLPDESSQKRRSK